MKVTAAVARAGEEKIRGEIAGGEIRFAEVKGKSAYDLQLTLADGRQLVGADMGWYTLVAAGEDKEALSDDDRKEIAELCTVPSFYDTTEIKLMAGDGNRVTGLVERVRKRDIYAGAVQVIWRVELWYFQFQLGGL